MRQIGVRRGAFSVIGPRASLDQKQITRRRRQRRPGTRGYGHAQYLPYRQRNSERQGDRTSAWMSRGGNDLSEREMVEVDGKTLTRAVLEGRTRLCGTRYRRREPRAGPTRPMGGDWFAVRHYRSTLVPCAEDNSDEKSSDPRRVIPGLEHLHLDISLCRSDQLQAGQQLPGRQQALLCRGDATQLVDLSSARMARKSSASQGGHSHSRLHGRRRRLPERHARPAAQLERLQSGSRWS